MKEYQVDVYNVNTFETIDTFIAEFPSIYELKDYMNNEIHNYKEPYYNISYFLQLHTLRSEHHVRQRITKNYPKRY